jgi:hypothetical protein
MSANHAHQDIRTIAETLLATRFAGPVRLGRGEVLQDRSSIVRFSLLDGPSEAPTSIVVKRAPPDQLYDADAPGFPASSWFLFNHWAGLQFLSHVAGEGTLSPRVYGGDRATGVVLMEDLGSGLGLDEVLLGKDPVAAEAALVELAATLGRMHAVTIGHEAVYDHLRATLGPHQKDTDFYRYQWLATAFHATVAALDITPPPGVDDELTRLITVLRDPGPFRAYTHGDPCPDNVRCSAARIKLIDFDVSRFGHALTEGVYGRIHFPTCWCVNRLPEPLIQRMEAGYRAALVPGCPEAADDRLFSHSVVTACAYWVLSMCHFTPLPALLEHDEDWGIATLRQRYVLRANILAQTTEEFGYLEALGTTFQAVAAELHTRWSCDTEDMPYYPAFR